MAVHVDWSTWIATLICIVALIGALIGLYYAFQGIDGLIAPAKINPCGSTNPTCAVRPAPTVPSTIPVVQPPTLTPTTVQIVPLPANPNATPGGIPQPSFAPAP